MIFLITDTLATVDRGTSEGRHSEHEIEKRDSKSISHHKTIASTAAVCPQPCLPRDAVPGTSFVASLISYLIIMKQCLSHAAASDAS
jgi:hypothetical protein